MPGYKGHLCVGVLVYILLIVLFVPAHPSFLTSCEWLFATLAGALFPDVDVKSKGQKYFYYSVLLLFIFLMHQGKFEVLSCVSFIAITPMLCRHRGIFHKPWFLIVVPIVGWAVMSMVFPCLMQPLLINVLFFIAGSLSHVLCDRTLSRMERVWSR